MANETLNLITLSEFLQTVAQKKVYKTESMSSFVYWIRKNGCPKKWPLKMWQEKFDEFLTRKI